MHFALLFLFAMAQPAAASITIDDLVAMLGEKMKSDAVRKVGDQLKSDGETLSVTRRYESGTRYRYNTVVIYTGADKTVRSIALTNDYRYPLPDHIAHPMSAEAIEQATGRPFEGTTLVHLERYTLLYERLHEQFTVAIRPPDPVRLRQLAEERAEAEPDPERRTLIPRVVTSEALTCHEGDCQDGYGVMFEANAIYRGHFADGVADGEGLLILGEGVGADPKALYPPSVLRYEGAFVDGYAHDTRARLRHHETVYRGGVYRGNLKGDFEVVFRSIFGRATGRIDHDAYDGAIHLTVELYDSNDYDNLIGEITGYFHKPTWILDGATTVRQKNPGTGKWVVSRGAFRDGYPHGEHTAEVEGERVGTSVYEHGRHVSGPNMYSEKLLRPAPGTDAP